MTALLTRRHLRAGLARGFRLTRTRAVGGRTTTAVVHGVTSPGPSAAPPERLAELVRGHWRIENELRHVRDVTLREDACRVRRGRAPPVLAPPRNAVVHPLREVPAESRPAALGRLAARPLEAQAPIGLPAA